MSKKVEKELNNSKKIQENMANSPSTEPKEPKEYKMKEKENKEKVSEPKLEKDKQINQLEESMVSLKAEIKVLKEKHLRSLADLNNQAKTHAKEINEIIKYSNERLLRQLLFFPDSYERALQASQNDPDPKIRNFLIGFEIVLTEFQNFLQRQGVEEIKVTPQKDIYDIKLHGDLLEVRKEEENDKYPAGTILQVLQKGYKIHERVLRPAMVEISKIKIKGTENEKKE